MFREGLGAILEASGTFLDRISGRFGEDFWPVPPGSFCYSPGIDTEIKALAFSLLMLAFDACVQLHHTAHCTTEVEGEPKQQDFL